MLHFCIDLECTRFFCSSLRAGDMVASHFGFNQGICPTRGLKGSTACIDEVSLLVLVGAMACLSHK